MWLWQRLCYQRLQSWRRFHTGNNCPPSTSNRVHPGRSSHLHMVAARFAFHFLDNPNKYIGVPVPKKSLEQASSRSLFHYVFLCPPATILFEAAFMVSSPTVECLHLDGCSQRSCSRFAVMMGSPLIPLPEENMSVFQPTKGGHRSCMHPCTQPLGLLHF